MEVGEKEMTAEEKFEQMLDLSESGQSGAFTSESSWDEDPSSGSWAVEEDDPVIIQEVLSSIKEAEVKLTPKDNTPNKGDEDKPTTTTTKDNEPRPTKSQMTTNPPPQASKRTAGWRLGGLSGLSALAMALVALCCMYGQQQQERALETQQRALLEQRELLEQAQALQHQLESTSTELNAAHSQLDKAKAKATEAWSTVSALEDELERAEVQMHQDQASLHRTMAMEEFGAGPHYAEFQLKFNNNERQETFTIELAPLYDMPSTVYLLLRQIHHGLWDGTTFFANTPELVMAQPVSIAGDSTALQTMERLGLARLPFAERGPDTNGFSHEPYTLCLAGNVLPGPNFYVNKQDNAAQFDAFKSPCFAKVVQGRETIDALGRVMDQDLEENTGLDGEQEAVVGIPKAVEIVSARLLSPPQG